jgi:hydrogenase nickel incorporation protein HypB
MCETCGCGDPEIVPIEIQESLLKENDHNAHHNRQHFAAQNVVAINLMGSPGSGKTALLEATAHAVSGREGLAALSGDLATENDANRLRAAGIPSKAITTYDLGQTANVVALAVTEGEDKPLKYPVMFQHADLVLLTKIDLLPHLPGVDLAVIEDALRATMPIPNFLPISALTGEGMEDWMSWLKACRDQHTATATHSAHLE